MTLDALNLSPDDIIRFRTYVTSGNWECAKATKRNADGSLHLIPFKGSAPHRPTANLRAIQPWNCEVARRGPRGGLVWEPIEEAPEQKKPEVRIRKSRRT